MTKLRVWIAVALLALAPAWLLATETGLRAAMRAAEMLTGGHLSFREGEGRLLGSFTLHGIRYTDEAATVSLDVAALNLRLSRLLIGRVQAESLAVNTLTVTTHRRSGEGIPQAHKPLTVSMPLRLAVEEGSLEHFQLRLDDGAREWGVSDVRFGARWRGEWIVIGALAATTAEAGPVVLRGRLAMADDRLQLQKISIEGPGQIQLDGALALADDVSSDLKLDWEDLSLPGTNNASVLTSSQGALALQGPWRDYGWTLEAQVAAAGLPGTLDARGRGSLEGISIQRALLNTLDGTIRGEGQLDWDTALRTELALELRQINPGVRFKDWNGQINGQASFRGEWRERVPSLEFQAQLQESQLRGYPLTLRVMGSTERRQVMLKELVLDSGVSSLRVQGQLLPAFALNAEFKSPDLQSLWAGLSGSAELNLRLFGTAQAPELHVQGGARELAYSVAKSRRPYRAARVTFDAKLAPEARSDFKLRLEDVDAGLPLRSVNIAGAGTRAKHGLQLAVQGEDSAAAIALTGSENAGIWRGSLTEARIVSGTGSGWVLEEPTALRFERGRLNVDPVCLHSNGSRACAQLQTAPQRQRLAFRLHEFELQQLRPWLPQEWKLSGTLSGTAALRIVQGELNDLSADLSGSAGLVEGGGVKLEFGPGELRVQPEGERLLARLRLRPGNGEVAGEVWLAADVIEKELLPPALALGAAPGAGLLDRRMQGDLQISLPDLAWLPVLSPEIAGAQGALNARLRVSGTPRSPSLDGRLDVAGGRVKLATPGVEFTDIAAAFESGAKTPLSVSVSAQSGGGRLQLQGGLEALRPKLKGRFTLTGENAQWINTPDIRAWVTPDLQLTLADGVTRLRGELKVPRAQITPRELEGGGIAPSSDQVLVSEGAAETPRGLRLYSEVRIVLGDEVRFDGLGLKTRLEGSIAATDEPGRPTRGRGELRLIGGRYKAYGQDLQIETGRLLFNGGPVTDPVIDLSAYRQPREDVRVGLRARGSLEAPSFSLYSQPALSQEEQLSWLVLGRPLSDTLQSGQRTELNSAAASLGLAGGEYLAQQVGTRIGLDEVTVGSRPGETAEQARFTIGKYLSPKLFVSYGFGLFQPGQFFRLQYELGRGFKLSGESGVEQGGDLLYSVER